MPAVSMTVNGKAVTGDVEARTLLVQFLRENLRLTGTHVGCDTSQCGACVVHVDGIAAKSCTTLALQCEGANVTTIEGLAEPDGPLHPMQEAFREHHGLQCGYCTPGMIMSALDIVRRKGNDLDEHTIREQLDGNICRCTGYHNIVKAIAAGAKAMGKGAADSGKRPSNVDQKYREETAMSATGIGAAVRRKEDLRFITGKGQYTDDVIRPGETRAVFVRSPHAHAKIKSIDIERGAKMPGVVAVLTGAELAADKIGNLICGWMIHSKDGSPMKMAPHPALASGKVNHVGDAVAVVIAETEALARDAAEKVKVDYEVLPAVVDPAKAKSGPQIHEIAPKNTIYEWSLGDAKATDAAFAAAKHVTKLDIVNNRLVPNAMEPRAALAEYDAGTDHLTLWNTSQNPHVARLVISAFVGIAPEHKLRVIAPDVGGGFGSKIFIYPEEVVCLWAARKVRPAGEMDGGPLGSLPHRRARPRSRHACRAGARRERQNLGAAREDDRQSRRLYVDVLVVGADLSLCHAAVGPVRHPADLLRGRRGLHQHRAGRCLSRRRAAGGDLRRRAADGSRRRARWASSRPICASAISSSRFRTRRR